MRQNTRIKNGRKREREGQHDAAVKHSYLKKKKKKKSRLLSLAVELIGWLLIMEHAECAQRQAGPRRGFA